MAAPLTGFDAEYARPLERTKRDLVHIAQHGTIVRQTGASSLGRVELPTCPDRDLDAARIESFTVDLGTQQIDPIGSDTALIDAFSAAVAEIVAAMSTALEPTTITTASPAFATVSFSPRGVVVGEPHVDDDSFVPDDGVNLVVVAGSQAGCRVAVEDLPAQARPGLPLRFDESVLDDFATGRVAHQQAVAGEIVAMPQFGQLHAGPDLRMVSGPPRALVVVRANTVASFGP